MRRHLAVALLMALIPASASAALFCYTTRSGNWSDPGVWAGCNGGLPGPADQVGIYPGTTITYDINTTAGDTIVSLVVEAGASLLFPPGDHRLQVSWADELAIDIEGTISVSNGTVIAFRSDLTNQGFAMGNNASFDSDGVSLGPLRRLDSLGVTSGSPTCGGTDAWDLFTTSNIGSLVPGDLVQFASGGAQGRMYEVVSAGSGKIRVCPELPDGMSLGPRLTPHAPTLAEMIPGVVPLQIPAAGDSFWAWHPWRVLQVGAYSWMLSEHSAPAGENRGRFEWVGGDFSGFGDSYFVGITLFCGSQRPPVIFRHNNFHEYTSGVILKGGSTTGSGCDRPNLTWNVMHDGTVGDGAVHLGVFREGVGPVSGGVLAWNTFYRTAHNTVQINAVGLADPVERFDVAYNTGFDLGTSNGGECEFIETDVMSSTTVEFNRAWRTSWKCGGIVAKPTSNSAAYQNNVIRGNYVQGSQYAADIGEIGLLFAGGNVINNYFADSRTYAIRSRVARGNVVRGWSVGNDYDDLALRHGVSTALADGNFLDGAGSVRASQGIVVEDTGYPGAGVLVRNNVVRGLYDAPNVFTGCVVVMDSSEPHPATIRHNVCDCDRGDTCAGVLIRAFYQPTSPVVVALDDNVAFDVQGNPLSIGAAARAESDSPNVTEWVHNLTRWPADALPAIGSWSSKSGEVARDPLLVDPNWNFNYQPTSLELHAGNTPPGSSIGVMSTGFDPTLFPPFLLAAMTIPPAVVNDGIQDDDGDGVRADLDNCSQVPNPAQEDGDKDGSGDVCDTCTDADKDGFGSPATMSSVCPVDNCPDRFNPDQTDMDGDGTGDLCDQDDGVILVDLFAASMVQWQDEPAYATFNLYRGDLATLKTKGEYTQDPARVALAAHWCGLANASQADPLAPPVGKVVFYLTTGVQGGVEGTLGNNSNGTPRPNANPCP